MRKFRFVGDPEFYAWDEQPVFGKVYNGNHQGFCKEDGFISLPIEEWEDCKDDWEEIIEPDLKRIPNQNQPASSMTKFEMAVFMVLQGITSNPNTAGQLQLKLGKEAKIEDINKSISVTAILLVKETFKQLENDPERT